MNFNNSQKHKQVMEMKHLFISRKRPLREVTEDWANALSGRTALNMC